ncbi:MAG: TRAP transporter substrate-binding protein DctP [Planctomycetales bacterium]|nr:TRAP transporter substrate-binding protein DctP [Planctomycetales bacterium]
MRTPIIVAALLGFVPMPAAPPPAGDLTIKLGTLAPERSPWADIIRDMAEEWKGATGGTVKFRIYPGGVAGDESDMVRKMRVGQLHAAALTTVGLAQIAPEMKAIQMPRVIQTYEELDNVVAKVAPKLEAILDEKGYRVLNWGDAGWVTFFARSRVVRPSDLKQHKIFVWAGQTAEAEAWRDGGYDSVLLPSTEIYTGLSGGRITAFGATPLAALSFQWFGLAKNMVDLHWAPLIGATVISKKKWDEIPEDVRPKLLESARTTGGRLRTEIRKLGDEAVEVMKKNGLEVHPVPPDAIAEWDDLGRRARERLAGKVTSPELVAEIETIVKEFREAKKAAK